MAPLSAGNVCPISSFPFFVRVEGDLVTLCTRSLCSIFSFLFSVQVTVNYGGQHCDPVLSFRCSLVAE